MDFKFVRFGYRFYAALDIRRVHKVKGICSNLEDGQHFLIWDFDDTPQEIVELTMLDIQHKFRLPRIDIWQTTHGYHAYCFKKLNWEACREVIAATPFVDKNYLALGIARGYFTLRVTQTPGEAQFMPVVKLSSPFPSDMDYNAIQTGVEYSKAVK